MLGVGLLLALTLGPPRATSPYDRKAALDHHRNGQALLQSEQFEEAAAEFQRAIELDPLLLVAHYDLGRTDMALHRYPEAVRAYLACVDIVEGINHAGIREREALERQRQDELNELRDSLTAVRTGKIKNVAAGPMTMQMEERIRVLEQLRFDGSGDVAIPAELHLGLGSAYFRQNLLVEAEQAYLHAVRANDRLGAAHNNLAVIYMLTGRYPQAHASIRSAEKAGFRVDARLKSDLDAREAAARD